ncbi:MAG: ATP synthase F1 subunit gamma [Chloroflexi bacterium]|nr:ATP synthase F1 subunit gamma [Chloroflexota bacterium]
MASIRTIRRRIRGIKNIVKITRAMEMVAASKMRRAQERSLAARPYAEKIEQVVADLAALPESGLHPLLQRRPVERMTVVYITPDRGLCGGLNANLNRRIASFLAEQAGQKVPVSVISVGRKGRDFVARCGVNVCAFFTRIGDKPSLIDTLPISRMVIDEYENNVVDVVYLAYSQFVSTAVQRPVVRQLLPVQPARIPKAQNVDYIYEPDAFEVLGALLPRYVEREVYEAILESIASEQSARMVAMRNATENGNELIQELTMLYNKARQESITKELLDIVGGAAALS